MVPFEHAIPETLEEVTERVDRAFPLKSLAGLDQPQLYAAAKLAGQREVVDQLRELVRQLNEEEYE